MKKDFVMPVIVLAIISLIMSGALAFVNKVTYPIIAEAAIERAEYAMREIIPQADSFVPLETDGFPYSVKEAYATTNESGFIFIVTTHGYGGDMTIICGIDPSGIIIKSLTLAHTETKGISDPVFNMQPEYIGKDVNLSGIDAISGATITSNAYKNAILDAFSAFEIIK
ncbi:MAG: FMN-binding protein [Lachnospiraceae bacterium]|nr:FMN-binding protein [Lachnospiraceae bacterium]